MRVRVVQWKMLNSWKYQSRFENTFWLTTNTLPTVLPSGAGSMNTPSPVIASSTDSRSMRPSARNGSVPAGSVAAAAPA